MVDRWLAPTTSVLLLLCDSKDLQNRRILVSEVWTPFVCNGAGSTGVRGYISSRVGVDYIRTLDLQAFANDLDEEGLAPATQARKLAAVKSLLTFGHDIGYLHFNVGKAAKLPKLRDRLAERILTEEQVVRMITLEIASRNRVLLRVLYTAGLRVSEVTELRWRDLQKRKEGGQISVHGKGEKTRHVLLSSTTWTMLTDLREGRGEDEPVFESQRCGALSRMQVYRIVRAAAMGRYREERVTALAAACTRGTFFGSGGWSSSRSVNVGARIVGHNFALRACVAG